MPHDHSHHNHSHSLNVAEAGTAFIVGIILNALFVILEAVTGIVNNSISLLTDAGHNLSDVASLILSLIAFRLAKKKSNEKFTYGYKKTTVLAALFNAVFLLITIGILGFESVKRLLHPEIIKGDVIAWVAGAGIIINMITALLFFKNRNADLNVKSAYMHMLSDALVSAGVVIGGIIITFTHWYRIDSLIGIVVMIIILAGTWSLLSESFRLSVDAVPTDINMSQIKEIILKQKDIIDVHHVHIWALSTTENALTAHISLNELLTFDKKMQLVHNLKHELLHHNIHHSTIEIEDTVAGCEYKNC